MEGRKLPEGWKWVKLGDVCELNPKRPQLDRADNVLTTFVPMPAVDGRSGTIAHPEVRPYAEIKKGYTYFAGGDVLFAKITPCMQNGKHAIASALIDGIGFGSTEFHVVRPSIKITAEWIHSFLRQPSVLLSAKAHFTGAVGQQRVPDDYLASLKIPLPPLPEQKRIAAILNEQIEAVEKAQAAAEARLEAAKALPAAYLRAVFESGEAKKWPRKQLGKIAEFKNGINFSSGQKGFGILTIDVMNMYSEGLELQMDNLYRVDFQGSSNYLLLPDDILFVRSSVKREGVGWPALFLGYPEPVTYCGFIIRARLLTDEISSKFLMHYLRLSGTRNYLVAKSGTGTITNINQENLSKLSIPIPPIPVQDNISALLANKLATARHATKVLSQELEAIQSLPAALLRKAFNGEL